MNKKVKTFLKKVLPKNIVSIRIAVLKNLKKSKWRVFIQFRQVLFVKKLFEIFDAYKLITQETVLQDNSKSLTLSRKKIKVEAIAPTFAYTKNGNQAKRSFDYVKNNFILRNICLYGGSSVFYFSDKTCFIETADIKNAIVYDSCSLIRYIGSDGVVLTRKKVSKEIDKAYYISGNFSFNLYHFLFEHCTKIADIADTSIPVIIDEICFETRQFKEVLGYLLPSSVDIIIAQKDEKLIVRELYYISSYNFVPPNFKVLKNIAYDDVRFCKNSLEFLRNKLLAFADTKQFPTRVYLSRKNASSRRKFNEAEVYQVFSKHGFVEVFPEEMTYSEQISLFKNAEYIAGGSGAAFSNLFLCSSHCTAFIFYKYELAFSGFSNLSIANGLQIDYITDLRANIKGIKDIHEEFELDCTLLDDYLTKKISNE